MAVTALIAWIITAGGGFYLLATWIGKGGLRPAPGEQTRSSRFPPALIFGHFLLAAAGLVVFIVYVIARQHALAWTAFIILLPVALLGFTMLARWIPTFQASRATATVGGSGAAAATKTAVAERHFPIAIVGAHGLLAVVTLVLVLLTALNV